MSSPERRVAAPLLARTLVAGLLGFSFAVSSPAQQKAPELERVPVSATYRYLDTVMAPPAVDDPESVDPVTTYTALARRYAAVDPKTNKPYVVAPPDLGFDPAGAQSVFRLEKREFLLGEPILVSYSRSVKSGSWSSYGGWSRYGRTLSFKFFMRAEDGTWLTNFLPEPKWEAISALIGGPQPTVREDAWLAVQQWCAVTRPGTYDLYCFKTRVETLQSGSDIAFTASLPEALKERGLRCHAGTLIDSNTGESANGYAVDFHGDWQGLDTPSPLVDFISPEVVDKLDGGENYVGAFAHFRIVVREGTADEREKMVRTALDETMKPGDADAEKLERRSSAVLQAIWFGRQNDFLPAISQWMRDATEEQTGLYLIGLARRQDTVATQILLQAPPKLALPAMRVLSARQIPLAIPTLINWLTDDDHIVRAQAEGLLCAWSGTSFLHPWPGYDWERPTKDEGLAMQPLWRAWWAREQRAGAFVPDRSGWREFNEQSPASGDHRSPR